MMSDDDGGVILFRRIYFKSKNLFQWQTIRTVCDNWTAQVQCAGSYVIVCSSVLSWYTDQLWSYDDQFCQWGSNAAYHTCSKTKSKYYNFGLPSLVHIANTTTVQLHAANPLQGYHFHHNYVMVIEIPTVRQVCPPTKHSCRVSAF